MPFITWTEETDEGEEIEHRLPAKWEICDVCRGDGTHCRHIDGNGITASEWAEWDPEEQETYLSGGYDRACEACDGAGKVLVADLDQWPEDLARKYRDEERAKAESRAEARYWARLEGGYDG